MKNTARDSLIWKENGSKNFTVKSAYQVALRIKDQAQSEHSRARMDRPIWKRTWKLNVPPKVRTFLWRACSNILTTRENLHRRKVQLEPTCGLCCQCTETVEHVLWECPLARNVWALSSGKIQKCPNEAPEFYSLFRLLIDKLTPQELEQWATVSWAIWNARNKFCFEKPNGIQNKS